MFTILLGADFLTPKLGKTGMPVTFNEIENFDFVEGLILDLQENDGMIFDWAFTVVNFAKVFEVVDGKSLKFYCYFLDFIPSEMRERILMLLNKGEK